MSNEIVTAPELAPPVGYAHAVVGAPGGRTVHLGGQTALDADGEIHGETLAEQFDVAAGNVLAALRAAGGAPEDLVQMLAVRHRRRGVQGVATRARRGLEAPFRPALPGDRPARRERAVRRCGADRARRHRRDRVTTYAHLSAEHAELLRHAEALARDELAPLAREGTPGQLNRPLVQALGERGLLTRVLGGEVPALELCLIREGLARYCTEAETAFAVQGLGAHPILANGSPEVVADWLPRVATGEAIAGFALTEPGAGSDVAALALQADRDGDGYRLTGEKIYISNAPDADIYSVFARTSERGLTAFAVPRASEGLSGEPLSLLSPHPIGRLIFDGVPVPADHVLGEVDQGFKVAMRTLDLFRPSVGAFAVGMAQAALDAAVAHVTTREAFGRTLSQLQGVSHQLADVATAVQAARLLVHSAASAYDHGVRPTTKAAAMAKLFATETAQRAIDVAIQVHGARALEEGHILEHLYREVRATRIYEGASEVQREIIARQLFRGAE